MPATRDFEDTAPSSTTRLGHSVAVSLLRRATWLRTKLTNLGSIADYVSWCEQHFGSVDPRRRREQLWLDLVDRLEGGPVRGVEFGVAWGYATQWWMNHLPSADVRWDAFDRFTGLPRAWRGLDKGEFDAAGRPPDLDDPRITWHVGDVEDTLPRLDTVRRPGEKWVILFDLDVFEPTAMAWSHIHPLLTSGDLLYFDEAFDRDERHVLDHFVLTSGRYSLVGYTPTSLALEVL
jgi:hypothetical protein